MNIRIICPIYLGFTCISFLDLFYFNLIGPLKDEAIGRGLFNSYSTHVQCMSTSAKLLINNMYSSRKCRIGLYIIV